MLDEGEVLLSGGLTNAGLVTRVGDTVRRPWRPTSPSTWALFDHLERVGFDGAPRFLGIDERGREILSFIPGDAVVAPYQGWALTDAGIERFGADWSRDPKLARWLRDLSTVPAGA